MDKKELINKISEEVLSRLKKLDKTDSISINTTEIKNANNIVPADVAHYIDHTLLKPDATENQIKKLCEEVVKYGFFSVCVNSSWVEYCAKQLRGTGVKVCAVVGFPLGAMDSRTKAYETRNAIENGADEIDMVINVGALKTFKFCSTLFCIRIPL